MISFIDEHRPVLGVEPICKLLPIAPSTYYDTVAKRTDVDRLSVRARRDVGLKIEIRRVLPFSGRPVVLDDIWLPGHMFKGLTAERLSQYQGPMYGLFESEFGVRMIRAEEKLRAVLADESVAPLLKVAPGSPLLSVERLSRTYDDQPVELRRGLYLTDQHHYRNELS